MKNVTELLTSTPTASQPTLRRTYDLVIVGAGVLGLAHAWHAHRLGLRTAVIERDERAVGASVRNFGHACITAQSGLARDYAEISRREWLAIAQATGIEVQEVGTTVVLRNEYEAAVLDEFAATGQHDVDLKSAKHAAELLGVDPGGLHSAAHLPRDLRLDPATTVARLARYLEAEGVDFMFGTNASHLEPGIVHTSRGALHTTHTVVAVNHDIDRFFPDIADRFAIERCRLRMLEIDAPRGVRIAPAILTGLSLLRYDAFRQLPAHAALRAHMEHTNPELLEHDLNHMLTQRPDGGLIIGDTHHRSRTEDPFELERSDELVIRETAKLFDVANVTVRRRWRGVYASSPHTNFVCETPIEGVRAISVTTGIGMTTSLGFAQDSLQRLLSGADAPAASAAAQLADRSASD